MNLQDALKKVNAKEEDLVFVINYNHAKEVAGLLNTRIIENQDKINEAHIFISTAKQAHTVAKKINIDIVDIMDGIGATREVVSERLHTFFTNVDGETERKLKREVTKLIGTSF